MKFFKKYIFIFCIFTIAIATGCPHDSETVIEIETQEALKNLLTNSQGPIIISLYIQNCKWCHKIMPIVDTLATDPRFNNICFYRAGARDLKSAYGKTPVSTPELIKQATGQNIPGYPFLLFMDQGKYIAKQVGVTTEEELTKKIEGAYPKTINGNPSDNNCSCDHN